QQVSLAQPGFTPDEERVVGTGGRFSNREARGVSEPIGCADDEGVEGVAPVEADRVVVACVGVTRSAGEVGGPTLLGTGERLADFVDLVGVGFAVNVGDDGVSLVGILRSWAGDSDT